jgi:hypothetical protein
MNELTAKLMNAHQICSQAYPYFERAAAIREEADGRLARDRKRAKVIAVLAGILATGLLSEALKILPLAGVVSILTFAGGIAAGMTLYRTVLLAPSLAVYRQKMGEAQKQEDTGRGIMREHEEELAFLPEEYCFPRATGYLVKITEAGRAADLNQALVMLDEQLHRWKVEEANESILAQQKMQTQSLKGIRKSSAINAAANVVNAASNISRWF